MFNRNKTLSLYHHDEEPRSIFDSTRHPACLIAERDIEEFSVVGEGFYATVKVGEWTRPDKKKEQVAIKSIKEDLVMGDILTEASNMMNLEHKNIIKLFGLCVVTRMGFTSQIKLVTEYAKLGSLISVIRDENEDRRSFFCQITRIWQYAYQIAEGMQYLHSNNLMHFDLAARNVLLVTPNVVKICDFGLARVLLQNQEILLERAVAVAWCAPELIRNQLVTERCDIWSYGVLLWELLSFGEQPWSNLTPLEIIEQAEYPDKLLPQPQACFNGIYGLMEACWSQEPKDRPDFKQIVDSLMMMKPVVVSAKTSIWTSNPKELSFKNGSIINIIKRCEGQRYLGQNDRAQIGFVKEACLNFGLIPNKWKFETPRPKISGPFDMRLTKMESIQEYSHSTIEIPVLPQKRAMAEKIPEENVPADQEPHSSHDNASAYLPMTADLQPPNISGIVVNQNVADGPSKHYIHPRSIPRKMPNPEPSPQSEARPTNQTAPVPKPRKLRPQPQDSRIESEPKTSSARLLPHSIGNQPQLEGSKPECIDPSSKPHPKPKPRKPKPKPRKPKPKPRGKKTEFHK